jgi:hypothetical protein
MIAALVIGALGDIAPVTAQLKGGSGTGFAVGPTSVLSNAHVVTDCKEVDLTSVGGDTFTAKVTARDTRNDLALLTLEAPRHPYASFRRTSLRAGEDVVALGFPYRGLLASDVNVSVGNVSAMAGLRNDTSQMQISAPVQPGNSGGPLLDEAGAVAGVVVAKLDALAVAKAVGDIPQNINFAIKGEVAQSFLRAHGIEPRPASEVKRTSVADRVQAARPYTYLITCKSVREPAPEEQRDATPRGGDGQTAAKRKPGTAETEANGRAEAQAAAFPHCLFARWGQKVCGYRDRSECESALSVWPKGSYCVPGS